MPKGVYIRTVEMNTRRSILYKKKYASGEFVNYWTGRKKPVEMRKKQSDTMKRRYASGEIVPLTGKAHPMHGRCGELHHNYGKSFKIINSGQFKKGEPSWNKDIPCKKKTKKKISDSRTGLCVRDKNPNWRNGASFKPYGFEFNNELRKIVRSRFNFTCALCIIIENGKKHASHHIDYNKKNNHIDNFVCLCVTCHGKTQYNRDYWTSYFQEMMEQLVG